ncbi:DedA family protein [Cardiobacteriales bacterium ML27]|uniref:DedA family protein n=2 Tax=Ostreibacterium oceani TaxID=2654998 RepID=A0A6N7EX75_9GAMM|nr:DedA family protein [Ostreibacterium oceani]
MDYFVELGHIGLFIAAFLAATLLPLSSELVLSSLLLAGLPAISLVLTATTGNVLGSFCNYLIGYWGSQQLTNTQLNKWLQRAENSLRQARIRYQKWGLVALLFAWVPVIGDPLTLVAGVLRVPWVAFVILVTIGKLLRYIVITYFVLQIS